MLPMLASFALRYQHLSRANLPILRFLASQQQSSNDSSSVTDMPKLNIPKQYEGLYDIKQEPGYVVINGRRYPYPYPGIHKEYNFLELMEQWRAEGKVDMHNRPIFRKMKGREKMLALQLWYQRDPATPVWQLGPYDKVINIFVLTLSIYVVIASGVLLYLIIVPKEKSVWSYQYWERKRKESHH